MIFIKGDKVKFIGDSDTHSLMFQNYLLTHENIFTLKDIDTEHNCNRYSIEEINYVWLLENEIEPIESVFQCNLNTRKYKIKNEEINMESEDKLKNLIKQWQHRKLEYLNKVYDEVEEAYIDYDQNVKDYISLVKRVEEAYKYYNDTHEGVKLEINGIVDKERKSRLISEETKKRIEKSKEAKKQQIELCNEMAKDAYYATSIYKDEENIKKILIEYDIIDENGKITV